MNLLNFTTRCFCGDKEKGVPHLRLVIIYDLRDSFYSSGKKARGQLVADTNLLMNNVERGEMLVCEWGNSVRK